MDGTLKIDECGGPELKSFKIEYLFEGAPLFVFIHGGYWQMLSKESSAYCVDPLVANGIKVAIMNYQLCPSVSLVEQMAQAYRSAVAILNYAVQNGARFVDNISYAILCSK